MLKSKESGDELEKVTVSLIDGSTTTQYGCYSLWGLYRGAIHITYPDILQSMHMALEKALLEFAENDKYDSIIKNTFDFRTFGASVCLSAICVSICLSIHLFIHTDSLHCGNNGFKCMTLLIVLI